MIVDYRDIYDRLKDRPADRNDKTFKIFAKLYEWKMHHNEIEISVKL